MITPADKAVLRLAVGLGLAVLVAYGFALQMPHVVCLMAMIVLCKPGPPIPPVKAAALALLLAGLLVGARNIVQAVEFSRSLEGTDDEVEELADRAGRWGDAWLHRP